MSVNKKNKKKKIIYIDDGSTIADMSSLGGGSKLPPLKRASLKEQAKTYFACSLSEARFSGGSFEPPPSDDISAIVLPSSI